MTKRTNRNPDHVQKHNRPSPNNQAIVEQLEALLNTLACPKKVLTLTGVGTFLT